MIPSLRAVATGAALLTLAASAALPAHAAPSESGAAPPPVTVIPATIPSEVMVLHATNDSSGIDPKLHKMAALSKPPFSAYNSYKILAHSAQPLARGMGSLFNLPTGRQLQLVYKDVVQPARAGAGPRYVVAASIQSPNGRTFLPLVEVKANPGEWFWVGGQSYQGGSLFIGIKIP